LVVIKQRFVIFYARNLKKRIDLLFLCMVDLRPSNVLDQGIKILARYTFLKECNYVSKLIEEFSK